jgi:tetratricopeptide (TPR) repeat protein
MAKARSESDPQFEIAFYEKILKDSPKFVEALMALGDLYTKGGYYQKGLEIDGRLARLRPEDPIVQYNLACSHSLMNDVPKARKAMRSAFALGYDDLAHLEKDPDLLNLLADTEFSEYLKGIRTRHGKKVRSKAEEGV